MKITFRKLNPFRIARNVFFKIKPHHRYEYSVELTGDSAPANVIRMVGFKRKVLELGAGPGSISRILSKQNECHVTAAEIDESAIEKLQDACHEIIRLDLNSTDWPKNFASHGCFEVIVLADVLEHLINPLQTLIEAKKLLTPDGYIVVSLPHAGHNAIIACLISGDFVYRDWGLLDRTHIRFFCINNIQQLFIDAGLIIVDACYVLRSPNDTELAKQWKGLPDKLQTSLASENPYGNVYQVVVKAAVAKGDDSGLDLLKLQPKSL
jgi:2-polyprenyl-3-methyl-5-hydroxy-6-metoxy-1,4-benzoquinol methylase